MNAIHESFIPRNIKNSHSQKFIPAKFFSTKVYSRESDQYDIFFK